VGAERFPAQSEVTGLNSTATEHPNSVAFHEAGHAVIAVALGMPVAQVSIFRPKDGLDGATTFRRGSQSPIWQQLVVSYAGYSAERRIDKTVTWDEDSNDFYDFEKGVVWEFAAPSDQIILRRRRALKRKSARLVTELFPVIQAVAEELLLKRRLSGKRVRELLNTLR